MADPFSLTTGIISLLTLAVKLVTGASFGAFDGPEGVKN